MTQKAPRNGGAFVSVERFDLSAGVVAFVIIGQGANQFEDAAPVFWIFDAREGFGQFDTFGGHQKAMYKLFGFRFRKAFDGFVFTVTLEKISYGRLERLGNLVKFRRTDTVGAAFVLLNLLEGKVNGLGEAFLGEAKKFATHTHPGAHVKINWIRTAVRLVRVVQLYLLLSLVTAPPGVYQNYAVMPSATVIS